MTNHDLIVESVRRGDYTFPARVGLSRNDVMEFPVELLAGLMASPLIEKPCHDFCIGCEEFKSYRLCKDKILGWLNNEIALDNLGGYNGRF